MNKTKTKTDFHANSFRDCAFWTLTRTQRKNEKFGTKFEFLAILQ